MKWSMLVLMWSASLAAEPFKIVCGEGSQLQTIQFDSEKVDFAEGASESISKAPKEIKLGKQKISQQEASRIVSLALQKAIDPYVFLGLYLSDTKNLPVSTLSMAKSMGCAVRAKVDIKNFSAEDIASLKTIEERQIKLTSERATLKGGDDFEEWKSVQKEIEKYQRTNEELRAKIKTLSGEKREEAKDQIVDNDEEIKGLTQEQLDFTKTPDMKRIVEIEKERIELKAKTEAIRLRAAKNALEKSEGKANAEELQRELNCLKSESCIGLFLNNSEMKAANGAAQCLPGELLKSEGAVLSKFNSKAKVKPICCAGQVDTLTAAGQAMADHFSNCMGTGTANECLAKYFDFKGDCAPVSGAQLSLNVVKSMLGNMALHQWIKEVAQTEKKPVMSLFCQSSKKDEPILVDEADYEKELTQLQAVHKKCKLK